MVINDLKVTDGLSFERRCEAHLRRGLARSFSVNREVGWLAHLHTCGPSTGNINHHFITQITHFISNTKDLTCLAESRTLCLNFVSIMGRVHFYTEGADGNFLKGSTERENVIAVIVHRFIICCSLREKS